MIRIAKPMLDDAEWRELVQQAVTARQDLITAFEKDCDAKIDERLYKKYMRFLLKLFHGKCAYCETNIESNQPGDVEHFRPKGRVVDENFKPIKINHPKCGEIDHPGYFWLAYDWNNLFPSCIDCNRYRKHGTGADMGAGKADRFPVSGFRAFVPNDEMQECALLLDPSALDPDEHLTFHETGEIAAKTEIGQTTLHYLGLNRREGLVKARRLAFSDARNLLRNYLNAVIGGNDADASELKARLNDIWNGCEPYTAMQRLGIETVRRHVSSRGMEIPMPLP